MNINDAWNNFVKTGSVEKYIEYKNICREKEKGDNINPRGSDKSNKYR